MYKVEAYESREVGHMPKLVFEKEYQNEDDARIVAEEVQRRISDVYGLSYTYVLDEE